MTEELKNKNHPAVNNQTLLPSIKKDTSSQEDAGSGSSTATGTKIGN